MTNPTPATRLISALLATALLLNGVAASGMTVCDCRASRSTCCCSRPESGSRSSRGCCCAGTKTFGRRSCCRGPSGSRESSCRRSGCTCGCQRDLPVPATPAESNDPPKQAASDFASGVSVATVSALPLPQRRHDASVELDAFSALNRCTSLCRFTL